MSSEKITAKAVIFSLDPKALSILLRGPKDLLSVFNLSIVQQIYYPTIPGLNGAPRTKVRGLPANGEARLRRLQRRDEDAT